MPSLELDFNLCITKEDKKSRHYLTESKLKSYQDRISRYHSELLAERKNGDIRFYDLPKQDISHLETYIKTIREKFDTMVVLGIGGSALGNIALTAALSHSYQQINNRSGMRVFVTDNVDPDWFSDLFDVINLETTVFNVISKSGGTAETMSQLVYVWHMLVDKFGDQAKNHLIATTDAKSGYLKKIADELSIPTFTVPDGVGGRFSVLSDVGLLSSLAAGIDIQSLLAGAANMVTRCETDNLFKNPAYLNALVHFLYDVEYGKTMSIMMPYSSRLRFMADWYAQLWGESLGKANNLSGEKVYVGQTPVKALGATDQHSQVQLYTEGPNNKIITLVDVAKHEKTVSLTNPFGDNEGTSYFTGRTMNELIRAELKGTAVALADANRPVVTVTFPEVNAFHVGEFIMLYQIQTALAGKLYQINPFDQPGVEAGKKATFALMNREGFEADRDRILSVLKQDHSFIL